MIVLVRSICGKVEYLKRMASIQGQPTAQSCIAVDDAKVFKTVALAEAFKAKYAGIGAGIEKYQAVSL